MLGGVRAASHNRPAYAEMIAVRNRGQRQASFGMIGGAMAVLLTAAIAGCGESGPKPILVTGKVTLDGKPATEGGVVYHDAATGLKQFVGGIGPDGTYSVRRKREDGVPPGLYKVTVLVTETPKNAEGIPTSLPKSISSQKFFNPTTTPFEIEVKADAPPGAYDLAVTK
jgi:hypothetical protein